MSYVTSFQHHAVAAICLSVLLGLGLAPPALAEPDESQLRLSERVAEANAAAQAETRGTSTTVSRQSASLSASIDGHVWREPRDRH